MIWFVCSDSKKKQRKTHRSEEKNVDSAGSFGSGSVGKVLCASFSLCEESFRKD